MRDYIRLYCFMALGALLLTACHHIPPPEAPEAANPYNQGAHVGTALSTFRLNAQFADIPAPQNYKLQPRWSKNYHGVSMRYGTVVYDGIWSAWRLHQWYLNRMRESGWRLTNSEVRRRGEYRTTFSKGAEEAVVHIYAYKSRTRAQITLNATPAPEPYKHFSREYR